MSNPVKPNPLCEKCRSNLIHGAKFKRQDPWMALEIASLLTLINIALVTRKFHVVYGGDPYSISKIKCLGCYLPENMKEIIKIAKDTRDIVKVKEYGENYKE